MTKNKALFSIRLNLLRNENSQFFLSSIIFICYRKLHLSSIYRFYNKAIKVHICKTLLFNCSKIKMVHGKTMTKRTNRAWF